MDATSDPMLSHRRDAQIENARFLMGTCGLSLEAVARRLGVKQKTLEKELQRDAARERQ